MTLFDSNEADSRRELRLFFRRQRRALSRAERRRASVAIARHVASASWLRPGRRIAAFQPLREEPDVTLLLELARSRRCAVYLPRLLTHRSRRMGFFRDGGELRSNRLGILEPPAHGRAPATSLDVVFVPLVAFDPTGVRLGMGGGYYDRAFAFRMRRRAWRRPLLIGIAYALQEANALPCAAHDVRLDAVVTERGIRWFASTPRDEEVATP